MRAVVFVTILLFFIIATSGFQVVCPDGPVVGLVGEDLVLPCSLKPPTSAVDMEVVWLIGLDIVHHYRQHQDELKNQLPAYRGRTSLFREELQRGNLSLELRSVRLQDANTYRCYIATQTGTDEATVGVIVEGVGSSPVISAVGLGNGSAILQCESTGWFPQPQMEWMDSKERILAAKPAESHSDSGGFTVKREVIVQESDGSSFICRVSTQRQTKEGKVEVPRLKFAYSRHHWALIGPILLFITVILIQYYLSRGIHLYKQWVMSRFRWGHDNPLPGKDIGTYTEPYIVKRPGPSIITQRTKGTDRGTVNRRDYKSITLDELFNPYKDEHPPKVVVLKGYSGYGKSITTRKIIYDWAAGKRHTDMFKLVVLLRCKEMITQGERSLLEMISSPLRFKPVMETVLKDAPHKVLFIIDGFDELKKSEIVHSSHLPSQPFTRAPPVDTIHALLSGRILPESFLLVTTRHTATETLKEILTQWDQHYIEIQGFTQNMVKDYFYKFPFENQSKADQAYQLVCGNSFLLSSCSTPVRCWMICSILKESSDSSDSLLLEVETRTSIYLLFVSTVLMNKGMDKTEALKRLAKLAKDATFESKFLFEQKRVMGLNENPLLQRITTGQHVLCGFVHQSIQEFLAALYFVTLKEDQMQSEVKTLLESVRGPVGAKNLHLMPVIRFLFGLSNGKEWRSVIEKFRLCSQPSSSPPTNTVSCASPIRNLLEEQFSEEVDKFTTTGVRLLFFIHFIFELHEEGIVKNVMARWKKIDIDNVTLKQEDCLALSYCLQHSSDVVRLSLSNCNLTAEKLKLLKPALANLRCQELGLDVEGLSDDDDLVSALGTGRILIRLRVENSQLETVQRVLTSLGNQKSVDSVHLSVETVSLDMAEMLLTHLQKAKVTGIMSVSLTGMLPHDGDGKYLCSSLRVGKDQHSFTVSIGHDVSNLQPALCELSVSCGDVVHMEHWTDLLKTFQQLKGLNPVNYDALDECVKKLLSSLQSLPELQKVYLKANIQTIQWAFQVFTLIHKCTSLQEIDVLVREQLGHGKRVCSFLSVKRGQNNTISLTLGQHIVGISCLQTPPALCLSPQENRQSHLSLISLTFLDSEVCSKGWEGFLKVFDNMSRNKTADLENDLNDLFHFLCSVSGLSEVELRVGSLTDAWAQHILTLIREKDITVNVLKESGSLEESLCSSLYVTKTTNKFRLAVEHLSQGNSYPALSYISVGVGLDTGSDTVDWINHIRKFNWTDYFNQFHTLRHEIESVYVHEYAAPLLHPLRSLPGLREVELRVSCLTEVWARLILSLIKNCSSLQEVRLSAGCAVVSEGLSVSIEYGPLLLENINHLRESQKITESKETPKLIILSGIKRRTVEVSNHFREGRLQRNRPVKITIKGQEYREEFIDQ